MNWEKLLNKCYSISPKTAYHPSVKPYLCWVGRGAHSLLYIGSDRYDLELFLSYFIFIKVDFVFYVFLLKVKLLSEFSFLFLTFL